RVVARRDAYAVLRPRFDTGALLTRAHLEAAETGEGDLVSPRDLGSHRVEQGVDGLLDGLAGQLGGADDITHEVRFADGLGLGHASTLPLARKVRPSIGHVVVSAGGLGSELAVGGEKSGVGACPCEVRRMAALGCL